MRLLWLAAILGCSLATMGNGFWGVGEIFLLGGPREEGLGGILAVPLFLPEGGRANPAGLGFVDGIALGSHYSFRFGSLSHYSVGAAGRYWGIAITGLDTDLLTPELSYTAYGVTVAVGLPVGDFLGIGVLGKGFFQAEPEEAFGWALDPAFLLRGETFLLGVVFENTVSIPVDYGGHAEPWPWAVRGGAAISGEVGGFMAQFVTNFRYSQPGTFNYGLGLEARGDAWCLRLGYGSQGIALGASVEIKGYWLHWSIAAHPYLPLTISAGASWEGGR